jgi:hypothetical protein
VVCALGRNDRGHACKPVKAMKYAVDQHLAKSHAEYAPPAASAQLTLAQTFTRHQQLAARSQLTATDAVNRIAVILCNRLAASGLPAEQIAGMQDLLPLFKVIDALPSASTLLKEGGAQDSDVAELKKDLARRLEGHQITLYVDASDTKYCGRKKVTLVIADAPTLPHAVLLLVKLEDGAKSCDAAYHVELVVEVCREYGLHKDNIVGIATDNTAVMPRFVRDAGYEHFPCVAHVANLMVGVILKALGLKDLLGWREFFARSKPRCNAAKEAKLDYMACQIPEHRFCYALPCLVELVAKWDDFAALLQSTIDQHRGALSGNLESLAGSMLAPGVAPIVHAKVVMAIELCKPAERLIQAASCDIRSLPFNFWVWFHAWLDVLQTFEADAATVVKTILARSGVVLTAAQLAVVADATLLGIKEAKKRPFWHLFEADHERDAAGNVTKIRELLSVYKRRECFTISALVTPDDEDPAKLVAWAKRALGSPMQAVQGFQVAYSAFYRQLDAGTLPKSIPPPPQPPAAQPPKVAAAAAAAADDAADAGEAPLDPTPAYTQALAAFWSAVAADGDYAVVGKAALRALAIPFSQTTVERAFSMLKNLATQNRIHAKERYLMNLMMLTFNEPYYIMLSDIELQTLGVDDILKAQRS